MHVFYQLRLEMQTDEADSTFQNANKSSGGSTVRYKVQFSSLQAILGVAVADSE